METCENCPETKRLSFELRGVNLEVTALQRRVADRDVEHDAVIQNIATRIDNMEDRFMELKTEVKADIQSIKDEIPLMFEVAINKLMARVLKWIVLGVLGFIGGCILIVVLAFARPYAVDGMKEILKKIQTIEAPK